MQKGQKTSERGGGIYDSPETFPIVSIPPIPLEFRRIQSNTAYNEFGGSGMPAERSAGGTERGGGLDLPTRAWRAILHIWNSENIICGSRTRGCMPYIDHRAYRKVKKHQRGGEGYMTH